MTQERLAILRRGHEAFNRGDVAAVMDLATPDVEWGATGAFPGLDAVYRGPEGMQAWVDTIRSVWEEFEVTLDEVLYDDRDLLVVAELLRGRGAGSGVEVEMRVYSAYWFEDGKLRKRRAFTEASAALEAAGLPG
jgi:ketosteroid isomerase-like protein